MSPSWSMGAAGLRSRLLWYCTQAKAIAYTRGLQQTTLPIVLTRPRMHVQMCMYLHRYWKLSEVWNLTLQMYDLNPGLSLPLLLSSGHCHPSFIWSSLHTQPFNTDRCSPGGDPDWTEGGLCYLHVATLTVPTQIRPANTAIFKKPRSSSKSSCVGNVPQF